jgi:hypothetical protein
LRGSSERTLPGLLAAGSMAALGLFAGRFALLRLPGFELAELGVLCSTVLGAPIGIAAARRELERSEPSAISAFWRAVGGLFVLLAILFAVAAGRSAIGSRCSFWAGALFLPVLTIPCALLAAALGVFSAVAMRGRWLAALIVYAGAVFGSAALTLRTAYLGPAAFALDPLLGYWPGPLYDEALSVSRRLLFFQTGTLAWAAVLVAASALLASATRRAQDPRLRRSWNRPAAALGVALGVAASLRIARSASADFADHARLAAELGASRQKDHCRIVYPAEKPPGKKSIS